MLGCHNIIVQSCVGLMAPLTAMYNPHNTNNDFIIHLNKFDEVNIIHTQILMNKDYIVHPLAAIIPYKIRKISVCYSDPSIVLLLALL